MNDKIGAIATCAAVLLTSTARHTHAWKNQVSRLALWAGLTAGCLVGPSSLSQAVGAATLTKEACAELSAEDLMHAVDDGLCTLDYLPAAGSLVANRATT